ncbi:zinc ribbon domain-containing protein [candidate division KSB1 bacterium]|nr:zinc ribbon domain-containing protein [candidate division KSB1 bacterium]
MPIYEYQCNACGDDFEELLRSQAQENQIVCPSCHSQQIARRMSVFGFSGGKTREGTSSNSTSCSGCTSKNCASCH